MKDLPRLDIPALLRSSGLSARKGLGQNFLLEEPALREIVEKAEIPPGATVLEVGPGLGSLTRHLARAAARVVAVELDGDLLPVLGQVIKGYTNVSVIQGDIFKLDFARLGLEPGYLVVANIPYYITGELLPFFLQAVPRPSRLVLTIQKEVAEAICARPGDLSIRALSVQVYGMPRVVGKIAAGAFYPAPEVDSAILRVDLYPAPRIPPEQLDTFFTLVKAGFSQRRKTLRNALSGGLGWPPARAEDLLHAVGIDPQRRAETLEMEEWEKMVQAYRAGNTGSLIG